MLFFLLYMITNHTHVLPNMATLFMILYDLLDLNPDLEQ
jgi:hypothetical protein